MESKIESIVKSIVISGPSSQIYQGPDSKESGKALPIKLTRCTGNPPKFPLPVSCTDILPQTTIWGFASPDLDLGLGLIPLSTHQR